MSYRIDPSRPLGPEISRIAGEEIAAIADFLEHAPDGRQRSLHNARKRLKRLRGLIKLVRGGDPVFHDRENARFRDLARSLSPARDADALVETAERFLASAPDAKAAAHIAVIRDRLAARRDLVVAEAEERAVVPAALAVLAESRSALGAIDLPQGPREGARLLARGARHMVDKARKALKQARKDGAAEDFHELRKALKYHRMHLALLGGLWPGGTADRRRRAEALGERLGELNDIDVMRAVLDAEEAEIAAPEAVAAFRAHLAAGEKALRKACLRQASELLDGGRKKLAARIEQKMRKAA